MKKIDMHIHTTASDGTVTPADVVARAADLGLAAIAITDHDTISGYAEALSAGALCGVEVVPGIEISTKYGGAVHILGYYVDINSAALQSVLGWVVDDRNRRNRALAELMAADGLPISYERMQERFGAVIGRPHFAELLVEQGVAGSMKDAFAGYVGKDKKYYLPRSILSIERSIETIVAAGGIAILAHPFQYKRDDEGLRELIEHCMDYGLSGMECRYSGYSEEQENYLERLAEEYGLFKTGGSDFHGTHKPLISLGSGMGRLEVPYSWLETLKAAVK